MQTIDELARRTVANTRDDDPRYAAVVGQVTVAAMSSETRTEMLTEALVAAIRKAQGEAREVPAVSNPEKKPRKRRAT
jgi:hypothetical protein